MNDARRLLISLTCFVVCLCLLGCDGVEETGSDAVEPAASRSATTMDACTVVTVEDATTLFGVEASVDESSAPNLDPNLVGECLWSHDTETSSYLLQFRVFNGENYYGSLDGSTPEGSEPIDLGDRGHVWARAGTLVDVEWITEGRTVSLSYSTVGTDVGGAERVEEVKALARRVSERLSAR